MPEGVLLLGASDLIASSMESLKLVQFRDIFYFHNSGGVQCRDQTACLPAVTMQEKPEVVLKHPPLVVESKQKTDIGTLHGLLHDGRWHEALAFIDAAVKQQGKTASLLQHQAKVMANLGDLIMAKALCDESLGIDPLNTHTYFLRAMVLTELDDHEGAESSLRKTIFLEPQFVEAHFQLGLLLIRREKSIAGIKSLNNALKLARDAPPEGELHHASGMTFKRFVEILEHEIEMYAVDTQVKPDGQ
ncbi:MAG: hypothetical protein CO187_03180 [Zetaproteobacteria bacterium CG_4_9_14_3_um_filter_53_7]|nr:MAG: hypothetical protein CO187_03180 [Zetaproteobacteria bacterium CG_4_9_14_3_um_filter_53_7]